MLAASAGAWMPHLAALFSADLTPDPDARLPAPTRYSFRGIHTTLMRGVEAPLRVKLEATVPAELGDVLAFYRTSWESSAGRSSTMTRRLRRSRPARVRLSARAGHAGARPQGRQHLGPSRAEELGYCNQGERHARTGQAKLVFSNIGETEAVLGINARTIKRAAGADCRIAGSGARQIFLRTGRARPSGPYRHPHRRGRRRLGAHRRARRRGMVAPPAVLTSPGCFEPARFLPRLLV